MPFRDVVGHARLIDLLARSVDRSTLPPSLIFSGPSGIGKRLVAMSLAQALNCLSPVHPHQGQRVSLFDSGAPEPSGAGAGTLPIDACGSCAACRRIVRGVHPDVPVLEPGDNGSIKVEQIRDIVDRAGYRPFEGRRRVVVIDQADAMMATAQNALLKTLEEPPSGTAFVLVTSRPEVLLPTVRSRCPQLRFRPLSADQIARALVARGHAEAEARAVSAIADGSLGGALEASAGALLEAREIGERVLTRAVSADVRRRLEAAKDLLANTGAGGARDRDQLRSHLRAMSSLIRDVELLATRHDRAGLANADVLPALERLGPSYGGGRGLRAFEAIDRALVALDRNAGVKIVADWVVMQL
jgi:DNA polymerase-3 subunit delta'